MRLGPSILTSAGGAIDRSTRLNAVSRSRVVIIKPVSEGPGNLVAKVFGAFRFD